MTVPSLRSTPTCAGQTLGADPVCNVPSGVVAGDKLIAVCLAVSGGQTWTTPSGWSVHANSLGGQTPMFERTASGSEPASYTFVVSGSGNATVLMIAAKDWASTDDADGVIAGSGNIVIPSVDSVGTSRYLLQAGIRLANVTFTPPGTATERFDQTASNNNHGCFVGDETVGSGATGSRTWTPSNTSSGHVGYMLAMASAPVNQTVTVPAPATASAASPFGGVTAAGGATLSPPFATASAAAGTPIPSAGASVAGTTSTATAGAAAPGFTIGEERLPPAATATGAANAPSLTAHASVTVPAPATATAAPFGGVSVGGGVTIYPPQALADAGAIAASLAYGSNLSAPAATVTAAPSAPVVSADTSVSAATAMAAGHGQAPSLSLGCSIAAATAAATAACGRPRINYRPRTHNVTVTDRTRRTTVIGRGRNTIVVGHERTTTVTEA